jgi:hypothetical protein
MSAKHNTTTKANERRHVKSALPRSKAGWRIGAPTWGNDGQDEARARAFIEGVQFATAQFEKGAR